MIRKNKKAYIRTLEAIISILIIFAFVITVLPKRPAPTGETPPELDSTMRSILQEVQNDEDFRTCLLLRNDVELMEVQIAGTTEAKIKNWQCLDKLLQESLPPFSVWDYAFTLCEGTTSTDCVYFIKGGSDVTDLANFNLPTSTSVYTKSIVITKPDVIAKPYTIAIPCSPTIAPANTFCEFGPSNVDPGKTITLQMWEKA